MQFIKYKHLYNIIYMLRVYTNILCAYTFTNLNNLLIIANYVSNNFNY